MSKPFQSCLPNLVFILSTSTVPNVLFLVQISFLFDLVSPIEKSSIFTSATPPLLHAIYSAMPFLASYSIAGLIMVLNTFFFTFADTFSSYIKPVTFLNTFHPAKIYNFSFPILYYLYHCGLKYLSSANWPAA